MDVIIFASDVKMCSGPEADHSFLGLEVRKGRPGVSFFPRSGGKDGCIHFCVRCENVQWCRCWRMGLFAEWWSIALPCMWSHSSSLLASSWLEGRQGRNRGGDLFLLYLVCSSHMYLNLHMKVTEGAKKSCASLRFLPGWQPGATRGNPVHVAMLVAIIIAIR